MAAALESLNDALLAGGSLSDLNTDPNEAVSKCLASLSISRGKGGPSTSVMRFEPRW